MVSSVRYLSSLTCNTQSVDFHFTDVAAALVRSAGTGIYMVQDGLFVFVNNLFQELTGFSDEELLGTYSLNLVHRDDRELVRAKAIENLKSKCTPTPYEYRFIKKNGDIIWVRERVTSTNYHNKHATVGSFTDVTEHKLFEEHLQQNIKTIGRTLDGVINAMAMVVESKDPYTAGHQLQVTNLALAIAKKLGLSENRVNGIRMAAAIHDIGKISVPPEILCKPGTLMEVEFSLIKKHPQVGYNILRGIEFQNPVAQIVLQHHERINGSGYPLGLSGENILQEARIIAVSDVVDAMASHRPYRPALGIDKALAEISQNKGILYDKDAVEACIRLFVDKEFALSSIMLCEQLNIK